MEWPICTLVAGSSAFQATQLDLRPPLRQRGQAPARYRRCDNSADAAIACAVDFRRTGESHFARPGVLQAEARWRARPRVRNVQIPLDVPRRGDASGRAPAL